MAKNGKQKFSKNSNRNWKQKSVGAVVKSAEMVKSWITKGRGDPPPVKRNTAIYRIIRFNLDIGTTSITSDQVISSIYNEVLSRSQPTTPVATDFKVEVFKVSIYGSTDGSSMTLTDPVWNTSATDSGTFAFRAALHLHFRPAQRPTFFSDGQGITLAVIDGTRIADVSVLVNPHVDSDPPTTFVSKFDRDKKKDLMRLVEMIKASVDKDQTNMTDDEREKVQRIVDDDSLVIMRLKELGDPMGYLTKFGPPIPKRVRERLLRSDYASKYPSLEAMSIEDN